MMIESERNDHTFDYLIGSLKSTFPKRKGTQTAGAKRTHFDWLKNICKPINVEDQKGFKPT